MADKLTPTDSRVQHRTLTIPNTTRTYHYLLAEPTTTTTTGRPVATALLIHGFPDLSFGWRYQVPLLLARGLRVVVPDLPGYGRTDAPRELAAYSHKSVVDDLVAVLEAVVGGRGVRAEGGKRALMADVGHGDRGGAVAWRFALWYPQLLRCVFSVCTPFTAPNKVYYSKEQVVARLPNFRYQLQLAGPEVEEKVVGRAGIRNFLAVMYGARGKGGVEMYDSVNGLKLDRMVAGEVGESPLLSKDEMDFYVDEYARNGLRGPLNWYRTDKINYDEERKLIAEKKTRITVPALMIMASRDLALPPAMAAGMDQLCDDLVKKEVNAGHWALWETPAETNQHISEFLDGILKDKPVKASI
ncbi:alpha/beta-hydrolase [Trichocladium antarcticum]|uniref:Alpha/beta-hydrolase n=1 Tax=Trichocladium antarcticum TaxID=1450529 RepID=A0AAN6ZFN9_9PEZI|nr:alpha/beta-hydrolase [Trichocladium antarcticum]